MNQKGELLMRVAVIGKGNVGGALAPNIAAAGHEVVYGVKDTGDIEAQRADGLPQKVVREAVDGSDIVIFAVHWGAVDDVLSQCGDLDGRILVDCTNPYAFQNDLAPLVPNDTSAARVIAGKTKAKVVKAFNQVGAEVMASAPKAAFRPLQFVASDDEDARSIIIQLAKSIGFDARDAGGLEYARELEGMARLWIAQLFWRGLPGTTAWQFSAV